MATVSFLHHPVPAAEWSMLLLSGFPALLLLMWHFVSNQIKLLMTFSLAKPFIDTLTSFDAIIPFVTQLVRATILTIAVIFFKSKPTNFVIRNLKGHGPGQVSVQPDRQSF